MATRIKTRAATVRERAQARGLSAPTGRLKEGGAQRAGTAIASRVPRAWGAKRERSASMHATRVQNCKPCMSVSIANEGRARRQFIGKCRAHAKSKW
eukprot:3807381-Pleurochrysis_carterae.AAC.1